MSETERFATWCVLELMGHRRLAGYLTEQQIAGAGFLRLDIPEVNGQPAATQIYRPESVYALTPCTEETARRVAALDRPAPVSPWELRQIEAPRTPEHRPDYDTEPDYDDDDEGGF